MFHLQMIGFGQTQDSELATKILLRVGNSLVNRNDRIAQINMSPISMTAYGENLNNPRYKAKIGYLWHPATEETTKDGKTDTIELWKNPYQYTFKNYGERTKYIKDLNGTNPFKIFNQYVVDYYPQLREQGALGKESDFNKGRRSDLMNDPAGLYD